ncbi:beta-Ig-H3/fasciclin [Fischerella thermalis]|nr:beta-Ig-H3/fasciclin [Fischerella thermalis]
MKTKLIFLASVVGLNILVAACEPAPETQTTPAPAVPQGETPPPATTP